MDFSLENLSQTLIQFLYDFIYYFLDLSSPDFLMILNFAFFIF